jgi:hypothetical protein
MAEKEPKGTEPDTKDKSESEPDSEPETEPGKGEPEKGEPSKSKGKGGNKGSKGAKGKDSKGKGPPPATNPPAQPPPPLNQSPPPSHPNTAAGDYEPIALRTRTKLRQQQQMQTSSRTNAPKKLQKKLIPNDETDLTDDEDSDEPDRPRTRSQGPALFDSNDLDQYMRVERLFRAMLKKNNISATDLPLDEKTMTEFEMAYAVMDKSDAYSEHSVMSELERYDADNIGFWHSGISFFNTVKRGSDSSFQE